MAFPIDRLSKRQLRDRRQFQRLARNGVINVTGAGLDYDPETNTLEFTGTVASDGGGPRWYRIPFDQSFFTEGVLDNQTVDLQTLPAGSVLLSVVIKSDTAWDIGAGTSEIEIGGPGGTNTFIDGYLIETAPSDTNIATDTGSGGGAGYCGDMVSEWDVTITCRTPGKSPNWFTTGTGNVWLLVGQVSTTMDAGGPPS